MVEGARIHSRGKEERAIRLRSTGLAKTKLVARVDNLKRRGNHLILSLKTTEPVRWHVRTAIGYSDIVTTVRFLLNPKVLWYLVTGFLTRKNQEPPKDF